MRIAFFVACLCGLLVGETLTQEPGNELVQMVITLLSDADKDVRALALEQVRSEAKGAEATRTFASQLAKLKPEAQIGLLSALADRGDTAARPAVVALLENSTRTDTRVAAVNALGFLGEPSDLPMLFRLLEAESAAEREAARMSLVRLPGVAAPRAIADHLEAAREPLQVTLIEVLATRRAMETIPDLLAVAVGPSSTGRAAAMSALGQLAGPQHIVGMVRGVLAAQPGRERAAAEKAVMFVCQRIEPAERRADPLLAAMDKLQRSDRVALLPALGRVGGAKAKQAVEQAIASRDAKRHTGGIQAICHWPDASVAPRLIQLAKSDAHSPHRNTALRALIRVAPLPDGRTDGQRLELLQTAMEMSQRDAERELVLQRARAIRTLDTLEFVIPYVDRPRFAEVACQTIVELAHHRSLREPHKQEFDVALDRVLRTSKDATVLDRANRYKKGQTWVRPK